MLYANGQPVGGGGGNANEKELTYAEYQALSESQKNDGTTYYITDINGDGSQFQPVIYSTEEREVGVWKDGKPLYEKTLYYEGNINTNTTTEIADLSSLSPDTILPIKTTIDESGWAVLDLPCEGFRLQISYTNKKVSLINSSNLSFQPARINFVVRYTKSTDTAGSGTWTPQGVPAIHYSTDEHVVGTWIDGKDIWEKTVFVTTNNTTPFVLATGVSTLISSKGCIGDYSIPAPYFDSNRMYLSVLFAQTAHEVRVYSSGSNYNNLTGYVTIQYTKLS